MLRNNLLDSEETMFRYSILLIAFLLFFDLVNGENLVSLRRRKRFAAFPEGASLSVAFCMTQQLINPIGGIFTEGVNWGISYQLPNKTTYLENLKEKSHIVKRSERRGIYENLELIIENFGFNGKYCILRALCEAPKKMDYENKTIFEKIIGTLFRYPLNPIEYHEPEQHHDYHSAARRGQVEEGNCETYIQKCPFSLIDISLGILNGYFTS